MMFAMRNLKLLTDKELQRYWRDFKTTVWARFPQTYDDLRAWEKVAYDLFQAEFERRGEQLSLF